MASSWYHLGEEPDFPTDEEMAAIMAGQISMDPADGILDLTETDEDSEKSAETPEGAAEGDGGASPPGISSRVYAYIPRTSKPESWSRKTRWGNGTRLLPSPPVEASEHVVRQWSFIYARVMNEGWDFCRQHEKQDPAWYVDFAKAMARDAVTRHIEACHRDCEPDSWTWLLDKTDRTPVLDATPYPAPYTRRN